MTEYKELLRDPIKNSKVYIAGGFKMGLKNPLAVRLNANENPFGPSPKAIEAMTAELSRGNFYPGDVMLDFKSTLAEYLNLSTENLTLFNGSGAAINAMGDLFLNSGDEVIISSPTYMQYYDLPSHYDAKLIEVPAIDGIYTNLDGMLEAITPKTKMMIICNPNNPTGTIIKSTTLREFLKRLPKNILCIVDEAYFDWVDDSEYESAINMIDDDTNVLVFRTFSKIYGMAGIRMGYAVANKTLSATIAMAANMFYSNRIAAVGAKAALYDKEFYDMAHKNNTEQREFLSKELEKLGCDVVPSQTSFILFNPHSDNAKIMEKLEERFIFIRRFDDPYIRVSIGRPEQNLLFLNAMKAILNELKVEEKSV